MDLFGKEVGLFQADATRRNVEGAGSTQLRGLKAVLEGADAERRKRILSALRDNLIQMYVLHSQLVWNYNVHSSQRVLILIRIIVTCRFNNPDKGAVGHAIVHRALWEYLQEVEKDGADGDKKRIEIFESYVMLPFYSGHLDWSLMNLENYRCQELLAEMVHTKDGSRAVREFLACGTAKDRKQIIKVLKPHIERMCRDDEAQLVLFTALDVIECVFSPCLFSFFHLTTDSFDNSSTSDLMP